MKKTDATIGLVGLPAKIVSAYVRNNPVPQGELDLLIEGVCNALTNLKDRSCKIDSSGATLQPAVQIHKSITSDFMVCLEDKLIFKSLKRHLRMRYNFNPDQYIFKWGLKARYPMVAPNYSKARSDLARAIGLGQSRSGDYDEAA